MDLLSHSFGEVPGSMPYGCFKEMSKKMQFE